MPFFHPGLLWFLPLAAIPILLHLLTLHRLKTVELSTFRFLFDSYLQQRRRMRFLEALLAMLRTAFILLLVLMVCRPILQQSSALLAGGKESGGRDVLLLVDCSASMNAVTEGRSAMERAREAAHALVGQLGREDRLTLVRVTSRAEELFTRFTKDAKEVRARIDGLQASSARGNIFAALLRLFGPEAPPRSNVTVYLITDCQASGWREVRSQGIERLLPPKVPFTVVIVGPQKETPNQAVGGDAPRQSRAVAGLPLVLQPRVINYSKTETADLTLSVLINDKELYPPLRLTLPPGETALPRVPPYTPTEPGVLRGRFEINSARRDAFPDDDAFRFTINVVPRVPVLLVNGNPVDDPIENDGRFLKTALTANPERPGEERKPGQPRGTRESGSRDLQRSLDVTEKPQAALTAELLRDFSVVILANCGGLTADQFAWLRTYVAEGGGLLIFPGDKVNPDLYNTQFFPVPGPQGETLTGAKLGPPEGDPDKVETWLPLADLDLTHSALTVFDNPDPKVRHFATVRIYKRFPLLIGPNKPQAPARGPEYGNAWPLARFPRREQAGRTPALVESRLGDGRVILAAFPAHTRWTNLPTKPDFVPLVLRLASYIQRRAEVEVPSVVPAGGVAEISVQRSWEPVSADVRRERGPSTGQTFERVGGRLVSAYDRTAEPGYYTVEVRSGPTQARSASAGTLQGRPVTAGFAVNLAPEESELKPLTEKEVRALLPGADVTFVDASSETRQLRGNLDERREVWRPLWFIVLVAILALEFLMATTSGRRKEEDQSISL
ncbi:MAG: VWA domain-containing protein [Planctomycetes bacterium]|nr:VWA domain-containing protein [Planctomycetota bacterium]